jgi:hypothetical protein
MVDAYAQDFAASHDSLAKIRAKMPRAVKYWQEDGTAMLPPTAVDEPHVNAPSLAVGGVATCTMGNWTETPDAYAYQWLRQGMTIFQATASSYTFVAGDVGEMISCQVTASNVAGSADAVSNEVGPVTDLPKRS